MSVRQRFGQGSENSPMSELWDDAYAEGSSYWKITPCDARELADVIRQAREGFEIAVEEGGSGSQRPR